MVKQYHQTTPNGTARVAMVIGIMSNELRKRRGRGGNGMPCSTSAINLNYHLSEHVNLLLAGFDLHHNESEWEIPLRYAQLKYSRSLRLSIVLELHE